MAMPEKIVLKGFTKISNLDMDWEEAFPLPAPPPPQFYNIRCEICGQFAKDEDLHWATAHVNCWYKHHASSEERADLLAGSLGS